jgi:hypothetical protein
MLEYLVNQDQANQTLDLECWITTTLIAVMGDRAVLLSLWQSDDNAN